MKRWLKLIYQLPAIFFLGIPVKRKKKVQRPSAFPTEKDYPIENFYL